MTVLYKLASEQLSQQYHYGFGLREMATVLVMAGTLKRSEPDLTEDGEMSSLLFSFVFKFFCFNLLRIFLVLAMTKLFGTS